MHGAHRHAEGAGVLPARRDPAVRAAADGEVIELVVVHGPPGIGKETIATIVSSRTGYPRLSYHDLCAPFAAVLNWMTPAFYAVRDVVVPTAVLAALREPIDGVVLTYIFDGTVRMADFDEYVRIADRTVFVGLTCDPEEHERRASSDGRVARGKAIDPVTLRWILDQNACMPTDLPGESHVVDTTGRSPDDVAASIVALL